MVQPPDAQNRHLRLDRVEEPLTRFTQPTAMVGDLERRRTHHSTLPDHPRQARFLNIRTEQHADRAFG